LWEGTEIEDEEEAGEEEDFTLERIKLKRIFLEFQFKVVFSMLHQKSFKVTNQTHKFSIQFCVFRNLLVDAVVERPPFFAKTFGTASYPFLAAKVFVQMKFNLDEAFQLNPNATGNQFPLANTEM
jgi:hypothetical protein